MAAKPSVTVSCIDMRVHLHFHIILNLHADLEHIITYKTLLKDTEGDSNPSPLEWDQVYLHTHTPS